MNAARTSAALVAMGLLVAACGSGSGGSGAPGVDAADAAPAEQPAATAAPEAQAGDAASDVVVPAALQFTAPLVGGGELDAATLADKTTVFWFWSPT